MLVSELIENRALLKYMPKLELNDTDVCCRMDDAEYFLITNTKEIFNTSNNINVYAIIQGNMFTGITYYSGFCGFDGEFSMTDEGHSIGC